MVDVGRVLSEPKVLKVHELVWHVAKTGEANASAVDGLSPRPAFDDRVVRVPLKNERRLDVERRVFLSEERECPLDLVEGRAIGRRARAVDLDV